MCVRVRTWVCVCVVSLETSFVYMQKVVFIFRCIISFILFPPSLSGFFFYTPSVPVSVTWKYFFISFSFFMVLFFYYVCLSCFVLSPFHNLWCCYFPFELSLLYWRLLYAHDSASLFNFPPALSTLVATQILEIFGYFLAAFWWDDFADFFVWRIVILLLLHFIKTVRLLWQFGVDLQASDSVVHSFRK